MRKSLSAILPLVLTALLALPTVGWPASPKKESKKKHYALLVGSVFTEEGFSLPGVPVSIKRKSERKPAWRTVSDRRGEFAVRLPPGRGTYEVSTLSKERENETRTVEIYGEERADVLFRLPLKGQKRSE